MKMIYNNEMKKIVLDGRINFNSKSAALILKHHEQPSYSLFNLQL